MKKEIYIPLETRTVILKVLEDVEIDAEDIMQTQIHNIIGELITFPVFFNRVSVMKAEIENILSKKKLTRDITIANINEKIRKKLYDPKSKFKLTEKEIEVAVIQDPEYKQVHMDVIEVQKQATIIDGLYWSAKSKDKKLETLSAKIKPEDFEKEIVEGTVNNVLLKYNQNLIQ
jgi:hypothetical protein